MKALVLAAGKSTRIASVTEGAPKPLLQINGESVLGRNLRWLASQGIRTVWINLHYRPEEIRKAVEDGSQYGVEVRYAYEPTILGTAGAVRNLAQEWNDTFLVVYGDSLVRIDLSDFVQMHRARRPLGTVALFDQRHHMSTAIAGGRVELNDEGRVIAFREGAAAHSGALVNAGIYLLEPSIVEHIPPGVFSDFGHDLFPNLLKAGKLLCGYLIRGYCLGLDTPASYQRALELVRSGEVDLA